MREKCVAHLIISLHIIHTFFYRFMMIMIGTNGKFVYVLSQLFDNKGKAIFIIYRYKLELS